MKKNELPQKTCAICGLPFTWRKKWARCWDDVKYCSERCRRHKSVSQETRRGGER
ncbi:DUF2256 domain-containing protein [Pseudomonas sp. SLFW]|uniref:DUF2256 domain-containing protein n=1 Tax=Pseudomonas sp. SLFW TaxID=2683259 RepID=UPI001411C672|nr:DUF2256 domain-containing protein [Pseudomonas sp. SLFW]